MGLGIPKLRDNPDLLATLDAQRDEFKELCLKNGWNERISIVAFGNGVYEASTSIGTISSANMVVEFKKRYPNLSINAMGIVSHESRHFGRTERVVIDTPQIAN